MSRCDCVTELKKTIDKYYRRNRSLIDTLSKCQVSVEKASRSIIKAATHCGCIEFCAKKQPAELEAEVPPLLRGRLCEPCREEIEKNLGQSLFYIFAVCQVLGLDAEEIITAESNKVKTLGKFNLR